MMSSTPEQAVARIWPLLVRAPARGEPRDADGTMGACLGAIRAGDEEAFNRFYDHFAVRLYRYLFAVLPEDEALVRDAFQETMLRVVKHAKPMPTEADAWRWLTRVGRSALYDLLRRRGRRRVRERTLASLRHEPEAVETRLDEALERVLGELPPDDRHLIAAFYYKRLDQSAIAEQTGTTRKAVESRLARLRSRLRDRMIEVLRNES